MTKNKFHPPFHNPTQDFEIWHEEKSFSFFSQKVISVCLFLQFNQQFKANEVSDGILNSALLLKIYTVDKTSKRIRRQISEEYIDLTALHMTV
jgi:hypothetical protein